ncbi:hypothetical protein MRB53_004384 [Persea americana]|uniref:Uncharacterized protein n=1 Tax=Persea americana TaxID=3435 RepID=A0ACC2MB95_PERAE|nr:hypothetical protein MRB53_004384 [Persea americana]
MSVLNEAQMAMFVPRHLKIWEVVQQFSFPLLHSRIIIVPADVTSNGQVMDCHIKGFERSSSCLLSRDFLEAMPTYIKVF